MPETLHTLHRRTMNRKELLQFKDEALFAQLEDQAINGQLDYDDYPPEEYRYFSKLSKLGYNNRHKGWTKDVCELKQEEYRKEYRQACAVRDERVSHMKRLQNNLIVAAELSKKLNQARDPETALDIALWMLENLLNEPGLAQRIDNNLQREQDIMKG